MDGLLLIDKPEGVTSHDVVAAVRRRLGGVRTGHAGTLDPFATGLLLVLLGRGTRLQRYLMALPKTYEVVARLGARSSTGDPEGELTHTGRVPADPPTLPRGRLRQRPPAHSAVHVDGQRAYRRARRGESFEVPEREVQVHRFEQLWRRADRAKFEIACSSGTYVRSLISELGDAYCEQLRRTAIGPFRVGDAVALVHAGGRLQGPESPQPLSIAQALAFLPRVDLDAEAARRAGHGRAVPAPEGAAAGPVLLMGGDSAVAVAEPRPGPQGPELKPVVGLLG